MPRIRETRFVRDGFFGRVEARVVEVDAVPAGAEVVSADVSLSPWTTTHAGGAPAAALPLPDLAPAAAPVPAVDAAPEPDSHV